jgi:hypothetical protein
LHFIEHEWQRFQAERSQWDTDRAELQVSKHIGSSAISHYLSPPLALSVFTIKGRER